jgi:ferric-dicitrate binding protein FerR (iron transport regulator)
MFSDNEKERLVRFADGQLDSAERDEVLELLRSSSEARLFLRDIAEQAVVVSDVECVEKYHLGKALPKVPLSSKRGFSLASLAAMLTVAVGIAALASFVTYQWVADKPTAVIAELTQFNGDLQWKGDGGIVSRDLETGYRLTGGTLECFSGSWATFEMNDGTVVTVVGPAELTMSDNGQKILYLDGGNLSANVAKQKNGLPMLIHTPTAQLEVLGTQLNVAAQAISTTLTVNEGSVRMTRLIDGSGCDVAAQHQAVATLNKATEMESRLRLELVHQWRVDFDDEPMMYCHGKWLAPRDDVAGSLKATPHSWTSSSNELHLLHMALVHCGSENSLTAPIGLKADSVFRLRGRINQSSSKVPVYLVVRTLNPKGGFSGSYLYTLERDQLVFEGDEWVAEVPVAEFGPDPENEHWNRTKKIETFSSPVDLQMSDFMGVTVAEDCALEFVSIELL